MTTGSPRERLAQGLDAWAAEVIAFSHSLHAEPELSFEEYRSCAKTAALMERAGFEVRTPVAGLETALVASMGSGDLVVALCAEYDALPGIGHACGHNVNGAASVGAALALAPVADELGITVRLIGTPGEETDGGKVDLLHAGIFDDVAFAMMVHAGGADQVGLSSYALCQWHVSYTGAPAHAATAPWKGRNALDALVLAYQALGLLRQQLLPGSVVSFTMGGSEGATNVIPSSARGRIELRATTSGELASLQEAAQRCLEAGAHATGTTLEMTPLGHPFAHLIQDESLTELYRRAVINLGRSPRDGGKAPAASTDMGNVSQVLPSLHPIIGYDVDDAVHHTPEFARHGASASADRAVLDGALAMALVAHDVAIDPEQRARLLAHVARRPACSTLRHGS